MTASAASTKSDDWTDPYQSMPFRPGIDNTTRPGGLRVTAEMVGPCAFRPGSLILDVGCGVGTTVAFLREEYALEAYGVDSSERLLKLGSTLYPGLPLSEVSAEDLPFQDGLFDGIIAECSLSVIGLRSSVLGEIRRTLKKGGLLLISDVYLRNLVGAPAFRKTERSGCLSNIQSRDEISKNLADFGFSILDWVDKSKLLPAYVASMMMRTSSESIWGGGFCDREAIKTVRPGYFFLRARKEV